MCKIQGAFLIVGFILSCCNEILAKNWFVSWVQERSYANGGLKVLCRSRSACGRASRFAPPALLRHHSCGEDGVEGWSGRSEKMRERWFLQLFFLIFNVYYASVAIRTEAVMMGYVSVENRGKKMTLFASAEYASCLKSRPNDQNNHGRKSFLHWSLLWGYERGRFVCSVLTLERCCVRGSMYLVDHVCWTTGGQDRRVGLREGRFVEAKPRVDRFMWAS